MLNLGGIFGAIGSMLPGYVQGREQAIASNWNDLNQYNKVQAGQIQNAFQELTFPLAYNMYGDEAALSRIRTLGGSMDLASRLLGLPGEFQSARISGQYSPLLRQAQAQRQLTAPDFTTMFNQFLQTYLGSNGGMMGQQQPQMNTEQQLRQQQAQAQNATPNMPTTTVTP